MSAANKYRANFLYPHEHGSVEEAGYEFANGYSEAYLKQWWEILKERIIARHHAQHAAAERKETVELLKEAADSKYFHVHSLAPQLVKRIRAHLATLNRE